MIGIINPSSGNLQSLINSLELFDVKIKILYCEKDFNDINLIILPGVGSYAACINSLYDNKIIEILNEKVLVKKLPFLGICVGMQILSNFGNEFKRTKGLGWIDGEVFKIKKHKNIRIPHMGWNNLKINKKSKLLNLSEKEQNFYFVHSYHLILKTNLEIVTSTVFHGQELIASIENDNIIGVQFHPEKSQNHGLIFFKNFLSNYYF